MIYLPIPFRITPQTLCNRMIDQCGTTTKFTKARTVCIILGRTLYCYESRFHDDVIKWKHFPCYLPFVRGIHRSPMNSPQKGQWRGALMFPLMCVWINGCANNREAGDLRRHRSRYDVTVMQNANRVHNSWGVLYIATNLAFVLATLVYRETSSIKRTKS